jgi:uncharacterized protein YbjT (DUF2867 family)
MSQEPIYTQTITFAAIAARAGYVPGPDGKLNLPPSPATAENLASAAVAEVGGPWVPGMGRLDLTITGPGPVWGYLVIAHALHGRAIRLAYEAPNARIVVWNHGAD